MTCPRLLPGPATTAILPNGDRRRAGTAGRAGGPSGGVRALRARGESLADSLDGRRREGGPIRGGSRGCPPHGSDQFSLGCQVELDEDAFDYDVTIQVTPELRVLEERLSGPAPMLRSKAVRRRPLLTTVAEAADSTSLSAEVHSGTRGRNPTLAFRGSRLLLTQLTSRLSERDEASAAVLRGARAVTTALAGVFHLDPVPHLMRDYVPERDNELRRTGENLSAALAAVARADTATYEQLLGLVREVADARVRDLTVTRSELGDVMLALREQGDGPDAAPEVTPAREMSDGLLRFMAVATALLPANRGLDLDPGADADELASRVLVVVEELENGLHPSQAGRVLRLIRETSTRLGTGVLATTHSPALLDALEGELNPNVVVCYREPETGTSRLSRLVDLDGYARAMAAGSIGQLVARGRLTGPERDQSDPAAFAVRVWTTGRELQAYA